MTYKEECNRLRSAGFSTQEIERLARLRAYYAGEGKPLEMLDRRHLQFIRWLVATGRLSENVA